MKGYKYIHRLICAGGVVVAAASCGFAQSTTDAQSIYRAVVRQMRRYQIRDYARSDIKPGKTLYTLASTKLPEELVASDRSSSTELERMLTTINSKSEVLSKYIRDSNVVFVDQNNLDELQKQSIAEWKAREAARAPSRLKTIPFCGTDWTLFEKKYPRAVGVYAFSRIAIDSSRRRALIGVKQKAACGEDYYLFTMTKRAGRWKITNISGAGWVS